MIAGPLSRTFTDDLMSGYQRYVQDHIKGKYEISTKKIIHFELSHHITSQHHWLLECFKTNDTTLNLKKKTKRFRIFLFFMDIMKILQYNQYIVMYRNYFKKKFITHYLHNSRHLFGFWLLYYFCHGLVSLSPSYEFFFLSPSICYHKKFLFFSFRAESIALYKVLLSSFVVCIFTI